MGFIERELRRISYRQLYAAQQALVWALDPDGFRAPYETILADERRRARTRAWPPIGHSGRLKRLSGE
jgi:hypothetical protein